MPNKNYRNFDCFISKGRMREKSSWQILPVVYCHRVKSAGSPNDKAIYRSLNFGVFILNKLDQYPVALV